MRGATVLLLGIAGCNAAFGLSEQVDPCTHVVGHDEDGDCYGDADDNCPGIANDQTDTDHDGVGDACDPRPGEPGDRLLDFVSFAEPETTARWIGDGRWQQGPDGDSIRFDDTTFGTYSAMKDTRMMFATPFTASIHLIIEHVPAAHAQVGAIASVNGVNQGVACSVIRPAPVPPAPSDDFAQVFETVPNKSDATVGLVGDNTVVDMAFTWDPAAAAAACALELSNGRSAAPAIHVTAAAPTDGPFAFEANGLVVRVESVAFYGR